jgi:GNAT superfamily N-acetyltransferase
MAESPQAPPRAWRAAGPADPDVIRLLHADPVAAAYAIGLTVGRAAARARWRLPAGAPVNALAVLWDAPELPRVFPVGDPAGIRRLLHAAEAWPERFAAALAGTADDPLPPGRKATRSRTMVRMVLDKTDFPAVPDPDVRPLRADELPAAAALWRAAGMDPPPVLPGAPPPACWGLLEKDAPIATAAVHFVSRRFDLAMVGNVVTHPAHRRRGAAGRVLAGLLGGVFREVGRVCLDTPPEGPARALYGRLGFRPHITVREILAAPRAAEPENLSASTGKKCAPRADADSGVPKQLPAEAIA